ncbi:hypothetical protein TNCT_713181 [Trichonephila clavata]|uniref:Uncharacterized protein n=1 Tax=Trichonephila clavata TaxID=2740835 RepID=A0A8X6GJJ0_TRICU|nr:hypothetical protein TNCT_713181 [Trichonephila clavata]
MAVSDLNSHPICDTPGYTEHNTPPQSPIKANHDISETTKTAPVKRNENEDGFSSPPARKLNKAQRVHSNPELSFNLELENRFSQLQNLPIAGNSSATSQTNTTPP